MQKSTLWIFIVGLLILVLIGPVGHMLNMNNCGSWGGWFVGPGHFMGGPMFLFPIIILAVVLMVIYRLFFTMAPNVSEGDSLSGSQLKSTQESAQDILEKRYARGELSKQEFEEMKKTLQG